MSHARYLGDAVYAQFDGFSVVLTTGSHLISECSNQIVLDPPVLEAFQRYMADLNNRLKDDPAERPEQI